MKRHRKVSRNPRGAVVDDVVSVAIVAGLAVAGFAVVRSNPGLLSGLTVSEGSRANTTVTTGTGRAIDYSTSSRSLIGVSSGERVTDRYGNVFEVLPGGQQVRDVSSGIVYSAAILQTRYDLEG